MSDKLPSQMPAPQLGDFVATIIQSERDQQPRVSEYQFKRDVINLLKAPFAPETIVRYSHYVRKLTNPLHVFADNDESTILFTVPPFVGKIHPTIATEQSSTIDHFFGNYVQRQRDLGAHTINQEIYSFLVSVTDTGNYYIDVIKPIEEILARYDVKMDPIPDLAQLSSGEAMEAPKATTGKAQSFTDEYDDD